MALTKGYIGLAQAQANNKILNDRYWSDRLLEMIKLEETNFVFSTLGSTHDIPMNQGTTVTSFRRYNSIPVSDGLVNEKLGEGTLPVPLQIDGQVVSGTIDEFGALMEITSRVEEIHLDDIRKIYQPELARHAAEVKEINIINKLIAEGSTYYVDKSGATNTSVDDLAADDVLTFKDLRKVVLSQRNYRRAGHVKFGGKPVVVAHVNVLQDLLDDKDLIDKVVTPGYDNSPIVSGSLQQYKLFGMVVTETLIAPVAQNASGVDVYTTFVLGKDPYKVITFGKSGVKWYATGFEPDKSDPLGQKATVGYRFWSGAKVIDPIAITLVYSASAYSSALADFATDPWGRTAPQYGDIPATVDAVTPAAGLKAAEGDNHTKAVTVTLKDKDGNVLTKLHDAYVLKWTSTDPTKATIANDPADRMKAIATGVGAGTVKFKCEVMIKAPFEDNSFVTPVIGESANYTVS